jgi:hypothetical protein
LSNSSKAETLRHTNYYIEARRTDGSAISSGSTPEVQRHQIYFANGDDVRTNEPLAKKSTYLKKRAGVPGQRDPQASCSRPDDATVGWVLAGEERVGGIVAAESALQKSLTRQ